MKSSRLSFSHKLLSFSSKEKNKKQQEARGGNKKHKNVAVCLRVLGSFARKQEFSSSSETYLQTLMNKMTQVGNRKSCENH